MSGSHGKHKVSGLLKMVFVALGAFVFTFAWVPLYRIVCQKVFGVRLQKGADIPTPLARRETASSAKARVVTVQFDGGVNSKLPWVVRPSQLTLRVQPGRQYEATYFAQNTSDRAIVGNAVPSVAPARASRYFSKTECFCFTAQTLAAGESREMPVRFVVNADLPADINTLTLSYTFFKNATLTARLPKNEAARNAVVAGAAAVSPASVSTN